MTTLPSLNLVFTIIGFIILNAGMSLEIGVFPNIPDPLQTMFNESFSQHYGTTLNSFGIATIWTASRIVISAGQILSYIFLTPLIDELGRKFTAVYLKYFFVIGNAVLLLLTYIIPSIEAFFLVSFVSGAMMLLKLSAASIYLSECVPNNFRGFSTIILVFGETLGQILCLTLFRPSFLGNDENWYLIPIVAIGISSIGMLFLLWIPQSPRDLALKGKFYEAQNAKKFYSGASETDDLLMNSKIDKKLIETAKYKDLLKDQTFRQTVILLVCASITFDVSPSSVEYAFSVKLHNILGFDAETIMTIGTIQRLIPLPLFFFSTYAIERYGRRWIFLNTTLLIYVKVVILVGGTCFSYFYGPSLFTRIIGILSDLISSIAACSGTPGVIALLIAELAPPSSRIKTLQLVSLTSSLLGSIFVSVVPYAFNYFPPLPYIFLMLSQPFIIVHIYRNLPETAGRDLKDIAENFEEAVRSRAPTRRTTILVSENTPLLRKVVSRVGEILGILFIIPLMDKLGRKFVAVYFKFLVVMTAGFLQLLAYFLPSFEAFLLNSFIIGTGFQISNSAVVMYLSDCAPNSRQRGYATILLAMGQITAVIFILTLLRPSILGTDEKWIYIPIVSMSISCIATAYLFYAPQSPLDLMKRGKHSECVKAIKFFSKDSESSLISIKNQLKHVDSQSTKGYIELLRDEAYRKALILLVCMSVIGDVSPAAVEQIFSVKLHNMLGFETETIMTIGTLQRIVPIPLFLFSTYAVERFGRRPLVLGTAYLVLGKAVTLAVATSFAYLNGPSILTMILGITSDLASGITNCLGLYNIIDLLVCELTPRQNQIATLQMKTLITSAIAGAFTATVPYSFNLFPPLPYYLLVIFQPFVIYYVFENMPETRGRDMGEISEDFEDAVRSRASTRKTILHEENMPLLRK